MNYDNFKTVDTTTELNGYPRNERIAIIADTRTELAQIQADLVAQGHEVEEVYLHRRTGHSHWHRTGTAHCLIDFSKENDHDTVLRMDLNTDIPLLVSEYLGDWVDDDAHSDDLVQELEIIQGSLEGDEAATVFIDMFGVLYYVTSESTGYFYDMNEYSLGLLVNEIESEEA